MLKVAIQLGSYILAGIIPYLMIRIHPDPASYLFYFPLFAVPVLTVLYFFDPAHSLGVLVFGTVVGTCGFLFTMSDFSKYAIPSPLVFLLQIAWLWVLFWLAQKLIEISDLEIQHLQEEVEKLELTSLDYQQQQREIEKFCQGIRERIASYSQLQSFTDQLASTLQIKEIEKQTESYLGKLLSRNRETHARIELFPSFGAVNEPVPSGTEENLIQNWIKQHRLPLLVEDYSEDSRFPRSNFKKTGSIIACPVEKEDSVIGIVRVESPTIKLWDEDDLRYLSDISNIISLSVTNALYYEKVESLAVKDALTDLYVRYRFDERIGEEFSRARVNRSPLSLVFFDIDHFKQINDRCGHQCGDQVLRFVSQTIMAQTRETDFCARYGGEEIAVIMPLTTLENASRIADRIRQNIAATSVGEEKIHVTISGGVACVRDDHVRVQDFIESVDQSLYRAKNEGRNRIVKDSG